MACTEVYCGELSFHDRYLEALAGVTAYDLAGGELRLTYPEGVMRLSR